VNYYNEIDPYCAQWLRNLIDAGHIPFGFVDTRSIEDVTPHDLDGFTQCHFFAGIGGWSLALRLASVPDDAQLWTGSCPCQPFSAAGKGAGFADERHLWPAFFHLISQCKPAILFGEQVAAKAVDAWIDLVHADLESVGYAFGSVPFPSASVGAPHIRDRNYWCASDANQSRLPWAVQSQTVGNSEIALAWRSIERIHAEGAWPTWVSKSGVGALADGVPNRMGRLRAYGNAINPHQAAEFISAALDNTVNSADSSADPKTHE
jgi:DNA (cytosine-5)-methyltransferase 1